MPFHMTRDEIEHWQLRDLVKCMMQRISFLESCCLSGEIPKDIQIGVSSG